MENRNSPKVEFSISALDSTLFGEYSTRGLGFSTLRNKTGKVAEKLSNQITYQESLDCARTQEKMREKWESGVCTQEDREIQKLRC